jgi:NADH-quinone oxidoreductase subunit F
MARYLLRGIEDPATAGIAGYRLMGGYRSLRKAMETGRRDIIEEVRKSGLRGRGGAGFPTGIKWLFASADPKFPKCVICNADEGEPGTFKDRPILEHKPHLLIEGMVIAAYALMAEYGYIYLRAEYPAARHALERAIGEAYAEGFLGEDVLGKGVRLNLFLHTGAGAYICGEETALIESLEGKRGQPRLKPPFPVNSGAFSMPTIVNNVETLANIPYIIEVGAEAYARIGSRECPGPKLFSVSGHVERPGVYELPMGTTLRDLIYEHCGGVRGGKKLKAVIPGGVSTPVIPADKIDCRMDFITMRSYGSMLGSGGVIVFDEGTCLVRVCRRISQFYERESCGKCTPCREGTGWLRSVLERIENGNGKAGDIELLLDIARNVAGKTFCSLGESAASAVQHFIKYFRDEFEGHIRESKCPSARRGDPETK